jgi:hypothetical protein
MKLSYGQNGYMVSDHATGKAIAYLTVEDAFGLFYEGQFKYDRRRSLKKTSNRLWADGVQWQ